MFHELLHAVWSNLPQDRRAALSMLAGFRWDHCDLDDPEERAARAFESWAMNLFDSELEQLYSQRELTPQGVFAEIYSGLHGRKPPPPPPPSRGLRKVYEFLF